MTVFEAGRWGVFGSGRLEKTKKKKVFLFAARTTYAEKKKDKGRQYSWWA